MEPPKTPDSPRKRRLLQLSVSVELPTSCCCVRDGFPDYLTAQSLLENIAQKGSVAIASNALHKYALFVPHSSNRKKDKKLKHNDQLRDFLKDGDTVVLRSLLKEVVLDVFLEGVSGLRTLRLTCPVKSTVREVLQSISTEARLAPELAEDCALFLPTAKSKTGVFLEVDKTLGEYGIKKQISVLFKYRQKEEVILTVEIPDCQELECVKSMTVLFNLKITSEEALSKISRKGNVFIKNQNKYTLLTPHQGVMQKGKTLQEYGLMNGDTVKLVKKSYFASPLWKHAKKNNVLLLCEKDSEDGEKAVFHFKTEEHKKLFFSLSFNSLPHIAESGTDRKFSSEGNFEAVSEERKKKFLALFSQESEGKDVVIRVDEAEKPQPSELDITESPTENKSASVQASILQESAPIQKKLSQQELASEFVQQIKKPRQERAIRPGAIGNRRKKPRDSLSLITVYHSNNKFWTLAVNTFCTVQNMCSSIAETVNAVGVELYDAERRGNEIVISRKAEEYEIIADIMSSWEATKRASHRRTFFAKVDSNGEGVQFKGIKDKQAIPGTLRKAQDVKAWQEQNPAESVVPRRKDTLAFVVGQPVVSTTPDSNSRDETEWLDVNDVIYEKEQDQAVKRAFAKGAFAKVYKGTYHGQAVAIKKLIGGVNSDQIAAFQHEFDILRTCKSPYLVKFFGAFVQHPESSEKMHDKLCLVMEYCPQGTLYDMMNKPDVNLDWDQALRYFTGAVRGISVLHNWDPPLVHRDIKSLNLLLDQQGNVKVCDFGLSRFRTMTNAFTLGCLRGTLAYCPPEIYDGGLFSAKSDIYALGVVLWELVARVANGKYCRPYSEYERIQADYQIISSVAREGLRPTIPPTCPNVIANIIEECWLQVEEQRPLCASLMASLEFLQLEYDKDPEQGLFKIC